MEIRRADVADWELVRDLRLRALSDAPGAFGSSYEREIEFSDEAWIDRLSNAANATLLCESDGDTGGMAVLIRDESDPRVGALVGMWVAPPFRGTGAADALVRSALQRADDCGITTVRLHVVDGNDRAERLYRRHGFSRTGATFTGERANLVEIEMQRSLLPGREQ